MPLVDGVLVAAALVALAVVVAGLFRRLPLPDSVVLVLVGIGLAELSRSWHGAAALDRLEMSPELVFFVFLPALVFESGLNLDARALLKNLVPVLALAVPAMLLSAAVIGAGLWLGGGMALLVALLFGALISATDPVAVVALFKEMGAPERLGVLVEGESLLNDATAIVLFTLLLGLATEGGELGAGGVLDAVLEFVAVFVGGALVGVLFGWLASEITWRLGSETSAVLAMSVATAYAGFVVAEHTLHLSGVMATVAGSLTFAALGVTRFSHDTRTAMGETWELIARLCNSLLFLLVGLSVNLHSLVGSLGLIALSVVLVMVARALAVYGLLPLTVRAFALPRVGGGDRHILWWGGLKGGLAIAIALSVPVSLPERQAILDLTVGVVLFSLLVNASTLRPLMRALGLDRMSADDRAELDDALAQARGRAERSLDRYRRLGVLSATAHHELATRLAELLAPAGDGAAADQARRDVHLTALRAEADALVELYAGGAIGQYTYLELRDILVRDRETSAEGAEAAADGGNLFERVEAGLLRRLREVDWAAGWLARYQDLRLRQHLERNVCGVVMCEAAIAALAEREDLDRPVVAEFRERYRTRAARRRERIAAIRDEFPEFHRRFQARLCERAALNAALASARDGAEHGHLGAKAFASLQARVTAALAGTDAPRATTPPPETLLRGVRLFADLSADAVTALAEQSRPVTFLPGDVVIGQGERGDALYVIARGAVRVTRREGDGASELAQLRDGDVFGEAALLGDTLRNATVEATAPTTLLRLTRHEVEAVAERWPEIGLRLREVDAARHDPAG